MIEKTSKPASPNDYGAYLREKPIRHSKTAVSRHEGLRRIPGVEVKKPNYGLRRAVVGAAALATAAAGVFVATETGPTAAHKAVERLQISALKGVTAEYNGKIIIDASSKVWHAPVVATGSQGAEDAQGNDFSTVAPSVPADHSYILNHPLINDGYNGWVGFLKPGVKPGQIKSLEQRAKDTLWVDYGALSNENLATFMPTDPANPVVQVDGGFNQDGQLNTPKGIDYISGTSSIASASANIVQQPLSNQVELVSINK